MFTNEQVADAIKDVCKELEELLIDKNRKYGNSAISPLRIFARADTLEQLNVRMDDKLSRIKNMQADDREDAEHDLAGYMILKLAAKRLFSAPDGTNTPPAVAEPVAAPATPVAAPFDLKRWEELMKDAEKKKSPPFVPPTQPFPFYPYGSRGRDYNLQQDKYREKALRTPYNHEEQVVFGQQVSPLMDGHAIPKLVSFENGFRHTLPTPVTD